MENREKENLFKNCRYCPKYHISCDGTAMDCLCIICPRNLGQCLKIRYCRETESVLDDIKTRTETDMTGVEEKLKEILERNKKSRNE